MHAAEQPSSQPLFDAVRRGDSASVKRLLASGIKADSRDTDGVPALMAAALFAGVDAMEILLDRGADPNAANSTGTTALMWALPDVAKVRLLLARRRVSGIGRSAASPHRERRRSARPGSQRGSCPDTGGERRGYRKRALPGGTGNGREPARGALPLSRDLPRSNLPVTEYLLAHGAKGQRQDIRSSTHWNDPKLIARVLDMGADINSRTSPFGRTAPIDAASSEYAGAATLKLLLDHGADPNLTDAGGETALNWAMHRADRAKIAVLKEYGAKEGTTG